MSRSLRHQPFMPNTASSDRVMKRDANRGYRRRCRVLTDQDAETFPLVREHANSVTWPRDGKSRVRSDYPWWRK